MRRYLVAFTSGQMELCRIRFWYPVASGSGISREGSRKHFWNLTAAAAIRSSSSCDFQKWMRMTRSCANAVH
jgi:hypothetical protein